MDKNELAAGDFMAWLSETRSAQTEENGIDVPCGDCTACCRSSYFIHIRPEETQTLASIPNELLFPAPGLPKGHMLLGYDENGRCPMFIDNACSIYEHRPLTCRTYDCRIFPATGMKAGDGDKVLINQQIKRWKFSHPEDADRIRHSVVKTAARFLQAHATSFPPGFIPGNSTQLAVLAIKVSDIFLPFYNSAEEKKPVLPVPEIVQALIDAFDSR